MQGEDFSLERGAKRVAWHFMRRQLADILAARQIPDLALVQSLLSRWLASGVEQLEQAAIADPQVLAPPQRLWGYYVNGPFFGPQFVAQRWLILQHMERFAADGLLVPID